MKKIAFVLYGSVLSCGCVGAYRVMKKKNSALLLSLGIFCLFVSPAWSSDCDDFVDRYNRAIQSEAFGPAAQLLTECVNRCEGQRNLCALLSVNLQSTARGLIEYKMRKAQAVVAVNPGFALRLYRQIIELGVVNPSVNGASISEAEQRIQELGPSVRKRIVDLMAKGEERLTANDYDSVRDIVYEIYAVEFGSETGRSLAERAAKQYEIFLAKEAVKSEAMLEDMMRRVRSPDKRKPSYAEMQRNLDNASALISEGLMRAPGHSMLLQLNDRAKASERELREQRHLRVEFKEADPKAKETPEKILAQAKEHLAKGNFAAVRDLSGRITGSLSTRYKAEACVLRGLTHAVQINVNTPRSVESKKQKLNALTEFNKAVSISTDVRMPEGYEQYAAMLDESKSIG